MPFMPAFAPNQMPPMPRYQQPRPAPQQPRQAPAGRTARNDRYLPPMPEMLKAPAQAHGPVNPGRNVASTPAPNVVVRGQSSEEKAPAPATPAPATPVPPAKLSIPAPEELGLLSPSTAASPATTIDWPTAKNRLEKLGASHYRLEKADDGWRFVCSLPHPQQTAVQRQFEVRAASDQEAMQLLLQQIEDWKAGKQQQ